ncbi:hypothetical protein [Streptomyces rimosus]|uniref:hypothetical protein n=1 Tax=Streptomyces rimosus TaxID=1927 RepID=UPI0004C0DD89|nr:hypothetical protein [Streptomyces rimosus]
MIRFGAEWTPHLAMLDGKSPLIGFARHTQHALRRVLRPVYQRAGVPARVTPTTARPWPIAAAVVLVAAF